VYYKTPPKIFAQLRRVYLPCSLFTVRCSLFSISAILSNFAGLDRTADETIIWWHLASRRSKLK
jgi:hypothetical protein